MTPAETGRAGEALAAAWLEQRGYRLVARNYRCRGGELDLVALRDGVLAFVEVRARKAGGMVAPGESITPAKRKKVIAAAYAFLSANPQLEQTLQPRFDVFLIDVTGPDPARWSCRHIESAFDLSQC